MKNFPIFLAGLILLFLQCDCLRKTLPNPPIPINVYIIDYSILTPSSVNFWGLVTGGPENIVARGVCWATQMWPNVSDNKTFDGTGIGRFSSSITGLSPNTTYYVKAYAETTKDTIYGEAINIKTPILPIPIPVVTTNIMTTVFTYDGIAAGTVTDARGGPVTSIGFCWNTTPNPTVNDNLCNVQIPKYQSPGDFEGLITGLSPNTSYYLKAFAINRGGTGYGNQITFTTNSEAIPAQDYLPLQIGNYWEFSNGNYVSSILIDKNENLNGVDYFRFIRKYNPDLFVNIDTIYIRKTSNGIVYERTKNSTIETVLFYLEGSTGEVWFTTKTQIFPQFYGNLSNKSDSVKRNSIVFNNCFRFEYYYISKGEGEWEWDYWLAPNLGFVKFLPISPLSNPARRLTKSIINGVEQTY